MAKKQPWHRQLGEGSESHELLMTYISLGAGRTPQKVAEQSGHKLSLCQSLSTKFKWHSRAAAYDNWMIEIQEKAVANQLQKDSILFAQRRSIFRGREYTLAQKLMDQADEMLAVPLFEKTVTKTITVQTLAHPEGEEIPVQVVNMPTKWTKRDALHYAKVAVEMMRLHLELETSRVGVNVDMSNRDVRLQMAMESLDNWRKNVDQLVDEEMARNPSLDRNLVTIAILEKMPEWAARDWKLEPDQIPLLTEGDEALPLSLDDISIPNNPYSH